jgi:methionyl-tRNA formyltransferase
MPLLLEVLDSPAQYLANGRTQNDELATYARKILKPEAAIDWSESAETIARKIRAFNPFPISYTLLGDDRLKLHAARVGVNSGVCQPPGSIVKAGPAGLVIACGEGQLHVTRLQLPGGKALTTEQMLNARSAQFAPGTVLGSSQTATESS